MLTTHSVDHSIEHSVDHSIEHSVDHSIEHSVDHSIELLTPVFVACCTNFSLQVANPRVRRPTRLEAI